MGKRVVEIVVKATDNASGALGGVGKRLADLSKQYPAMAIIGAASLGTIATKLGEMAAAAVRSYQETMKLGAAMFDLSQKTDKTVESLSAWTYLTEQAGSNIGDYEQVYRKLRDTMASAIQGNETAISQFKTLGVTIVDGNGKMRDIDAVLMDIADSLKQYGANSIEAATAVDIMGRGSMAFNAVLKQGSEEIERQRGKIIALGGVLSSEFARSADAAEDSQNTVKAAFGGLKARLSVPVNWAVALANENLAKVAGEINSTIDDLGQKVGKGFQIFVDKGGSRAKAASKSAQEDVDKLVKDGRDAIEAAAKKLNVSITEPVWDASALKIIDQPRLSEAIAKDIAAAMVKGREDAAKKAAEASRLASSAAAAPPVNMSFVWDFRQEDADRVQSQQNMADELKRLMDSTDVDFSELTARMGNPDAGPKEMTEDMKDALDIAKQLGAGLQDIGTTAIDAFLNGEAGAIKFGDMIRRTITKAIAEAIMKFVVLKALSAITGIPMAQGGAMPKRALGGAIQHAALGYAVPDGPRGMDSVLIAGMPGEQVINRQLSDKLNRFLNSYESGAAVSPFSMSHGDGYGRSVLNFNIGRPMSTLDAIDLGRNAARAQRKYAEANL